MFFLRTAGAIGLALIVVGSADAEPAGRSSAPLPAPAAALASTLKMASVDRGTLVLNAVRILFSAPDGVQEDSTRLRDSVSALLRRTPAGQYEQVPLPLGVNAWRDILGTRGSNNGVIAAIVTDRSAGLLYYGLANLDDATLDWLSRDRETIHYLRRHASVFAAFGRGLRIRNDRILVPGGAEAESLWQAVAGASPAEPARFIRTLFRSDHARLAFFYDSIAHLDASRQRFALAGITGPTSAERTRDLVAVFRECAPDWHVDPRPFSRPPFDPSITLSVVDIDPAGVLRGPSIAVLEQVFRDDSGIDVSFKEVSRKIDAPAVQPDAAWLAAHVNLGQSLMGRRRLDAFLFGQRVLANQNVEPRAAATVLRAFLSMPALMLTLERAGVRDAAVLLAAARHANAVHAIGDDDQHLNAVAAFQSAIGFIERGTRSHTLTPARAQALVSSLAAVPVDRGRGYEERIARWLQSTMLDAAPAQSEETTEPIESAILALMAGTAGDRQRPIVEWEGVRYRADPAGAELLRLRSVRERQGGLSIDAAIRPLLERGSNGSTPAARRDFAETLMSMIYAAHLGDPDGPALAADNVARRHAFEFTAVRPGMPSMTAWRLPTEIFGSASGWGVHGSLLALDTALRRLALRRLDQTWLPTAPKMPMLDRQVSMLTVALMNPLALADADRDRIADAVRRGRERFAAVRRNATLLEAYAADTGMSEWRREALRWALANDPDGVDSYVELTDFFYAGSAAPEYAGVRALHAWGTAMLPLTGCLCLRMPGPALGDDLGGRPSTGLLATRGIDVTLRIAEMLSRLKLPASLAPAILAFAMQDVMDTANMAHFDDWHAYSRAAKTLTDERLVDYIAALTADGPLLPAGVDDKK